MRKTIFIAALILATLACNFSTEDPEAIKSLERTQVAIELTQTAIAAPIKVPPPDTVAPPTAASPSATPIPQNGSISGTLGYPSSGIPPLEVYAISKRIRRNIICEDRAEPNNFFDQGCGGGRILFSCLRHCWQQYDSGRFY